MVPIAPRAIFGTVWLALGAIVFAIDVVRGDTPTLTIREDVPAAADPVR